MSQKRRRSGQLAKAAHSMQEGQARSLDALAEFETFREMFAPEIRRDLMRGATEKEILEKYKPLVAARMVQTAVAGDAKNAIAAGREVYNRTEGTPAAKLDITHKMERLKDEELDALLESELKKLEAIETTALSIQDADEEESEEEE